MKAITKYVSTDGVEFTTAEACEKYERTAATLIDAMSPLGSRPKLDAGEYVQHDQQAALTAKRAVWKVAQSIHGSYPVFSNPADIVHPFSGAGRIIDDAGPECLRRAWGRIGCINWDNFREYQQPYYANNPHEAEKIANA